MVIIMTSISILFAGIDTYTIHNAFKYTPCIRLHKWRNVTNYNDQMLEPIDKDYNYIMGCRISDYFLARGFRLLFLISMI